MKQKIPLIVLFAILMANVLASGANTTFSPDYRIDSIRNTQTPLLSQEEYNISSYRSYLDATLDIMMTKHLNISTGVVFHSVTHDLSAYSVETSLSTYYWMIDALSIAYAITNNVTYEIVMSRVANKMVSLFKDPIYPGFYVNEYSDLELRQTKRPGVQAYAYWALEIAESTNASLDFTTEKESALRCLTDMLYDDVYGGFYFYTMRNGSLTVPISFSEVYPNYGKRLDHLALATTLLFEVGSSSGNTTLVNMAERSVDFMLQYMKDYFTMEYMGLKLAVDQDGGIVIVDEGDRVARSIVTDINAMAIRTLIRGYEATGNSTYLDSANELFETLFQNNWDGENGGWYAEVVDGVPYDPLDDEDVKFYKYS
ncbi:MAG: hypothetical protein ACFFFK_08420, partial [Candidatus Thorarchaeota archaeon]